MSDASLPLDRIGLGGADLALLLRAGVKTPAQAVSRIALYPSLLDDARRDLVLSALRVHLTTADVTATEIATAVAESHAMRGNVTPPAHATAGPAARRSVLRGPAVPPLFPPGPWRVRYQGLRPTCVAFATVACLELHRALRGNGLINLSEQFLFWAMKTQSDDGRQAPSTNKLLHAAQALATAGICLEEDCRYDGRKLAPVYFGGPPPATEVQTVARAMTKAWFEAGLALHHDDEPERNPVGPAARVLGFLREGGAVAVAVPMVHDRGEPPWQTNWASDEAINYGCVPDPAGDYVKVSGHCVCVLGFVPDPQEPTGGYFLFRNSWDVVWAGSVPAPDGPTRRYPPVPAPGYGAISATYVDEHCWELLAFSQGP